MVLPRVMFPGSLASVNAHQLQTVALQLLAVTAVATPSTRRANRKAVLLSIKAHRFALSSRKTAVALLQGISVLEFVPTSDIVLGYPVLILANDSILRSDHSLFVVACHRSLQKVTSHSSLLPTLCHAYPSDGDIVWLQCEGKRRRHRMTGDGISGSHRPH